MRLAKACAVSFPRPKSTLIVLTLTLGTSYHSAGFKKNGTEFVPALGKAFCEISVEITEKGIVNVSI